MKHYFCGLMLVIGSVALADEAKTANDKSGVEVSASDATTWRLCSQDPSEWQIPKGLSEMQRATWIETQQEAINAQIGIEAEAAKQPNRELQLKSGSAPKNLVEKKMVLEFRKQKIEAETKLLKVRTQERFDEINLKMDEIEGQLKARVRQLSPTPGQLA